MLTDINQIMHIRQLKLTALDQVQQRPADRMAHGFFPSRPFDHVAPPLQPDHPGQGLAHLGADLAEFQIEGIKRPQIATAGGIGEHGGGVTVVIVTAQGFA